MDYKNANGRFKELKMEFQIQYFVLLIIINYIKFINFIAIK